ncbi:MAG: phenylalanine--tRNA ligase subunit beta [Omnitrophica bacterium]|nr:phenylalanine--tRNA ligase subunit beta [Candidatus Omnitrophota bacterium]
MKVSYSWIRDYVDANIDPKKLMSLLTMSGTNVTSYESTGGDYIFDFEITANRPDCLAVIGIAREAAALLGKPLKIPKELRRLAKPKSKSKKETSLSISVKDAKLCPRYTARVIRDVEVGPSPDWLRERIISAGLRPVNNIVDITNFVLLETGQPLHAFDLDRINGAISVRCARKGERIITIDNVPRTCEEGMLVIADESAPVAIAGVMGGLQAEVNDMTRTILLESAFFNPISIRRTARFLRVGSESSYRFERKIDVDMVPRASERASALIVEISGGNIGPLIDIGKVSSPAKTINFSVDRANSILGTSVDKKRAVKILKALGFSMEDKKGSVKVTTPGFRQDVKGDADLAEEVARIYGYENIPLTIPRIAGNTRIKDFINIFEEKIKTTLTRLNLNEIITYSLISKSSIRYANINDDETVVIENPLSIDQEIMRPSMLPGMLKAISHNFKRYAKSLSFFEVGKVYGEKNGIYTEEPVLSLGLAGVKREEWSSPGEDFSFFDIKGTLEKLLGTLGFSGEISFKKGAHAGLGANTNAIAEYKGKQVARIGEVDRDVSRGFDIEKRVFYGEVYIENLLKEAQLDRKYIPYSRYPSVMRDISIVADKGTASCDIVSIIKEVGRGLVKETLLVELYKGKQIPKDKRALLYRIEYRSDEKTLEDAEVEKVHSEIKSALTGKLSVSFR